MIRKRNDVFTYEFMARGVRYYGSLPNARDKMEATALEAEERLKVYRGEWRKGPDVTTFGDFIDRVYMPYAKAHKASWPTDEYRCERLKRKFGRLPIEQVTPRLLSEYAEAELRRKSKRKKLFSPATVKKLMHLCSAILQMALNEQLVKFNAARSIPKGTRSLLAEKGARRRFLDLKEEAALFAALEGRRSHLIPLVKTALLTGMRKGELLTLKWSRVNLGDKPMVVKLDNKDWVIHPNWLLVERSKNGLRRLIPLSGRAQAVLRALSADASRGLYVFSSPWSDERLVQLRRGFGGARDDAGIKDFTFHDLRHTFATRAIDTGATWAAVRDILGHKPLNVTDGYIHATPEAMRQAVEGVANFDRTDENYGRITVVRAAG